MTYNWNTKNQSEIDPIDLRVFDKANPLLQLDDETSSKNTPTHIIIAIGYKGTLRKLIFKLTNITKYLNKNKKPNELFILQTIKSQMLKNSFIDKAYYHKFLKC